MDSGSDMGTGIDTDAEMKPDGGGCRISPDTSGVYMLLMITDTASPTRGVGSASLYFFRALPTRCAPYPVQPSDCR